LAAHQLIVNMSRLLAVYQESLRGSLNLAAHQLIVNMSRLLAVYQESLRGSMNLAAHQLIVNMSRHFLSAFASTAFHLIASMSWYFGV
jgi:trehalose-6-phosphate synthase